MSIVVQGLEVKAAKNDELGIENTFNLTGGILAWNGDLVSP
jgi:hypothetical protein